MFGDLGKNFGMRDFEMVIYGHSRSGHDSDNRVSHSGIIYQPFNYVAMLNQLYIDSTPSVMIIPILSFDQMHSWNGEGYDAICVASNPKAYIVSGATCGDIAECDLGEERVKTAFSGFQDASAVIADLCRKAPLAGDERDGLHCGDLRKYLAGLKTFLSPDQPSEAREGKCFRLIHFAPGVCLSPGTQAGPAAAPGHPAPMPLLLVAMSLTVWFSSLLQQKLLHGFSVQENKPDEKYCGLIPVCDEICSCPICLAKLVLSGDPLFDELLEEDGFVADMWKIAGCDTIVETVEDDPNLRRAAMLLQRKD
jgi:hypothetical protein